MPENPKRETSMRETSMRSLITAGLCATLLAATGVAEDKAPAEGLTGEAAAKAMTLPSGFSAQLVLSEPDVHQPIAYTIDDRGRLWVLENANYPECPGPAKNNILILEDTDGDGKADKRTVFFDKLTFASGILVGFGGVWVGAPPNLLFFPDADRDDKPDGEPQVALDGWGWEDTHETLNGFIWGPDGWMYGTHGVFTHSKVGVPGTPAEQRVPINAGVWRFHPQDKRFEMFSEGASNQWGIDFNDRGQAFITACVIPHMFHAIQGGRYHRQAGEHFNKHSYESIKTIADHGHERAAFCGSMIYLGGLFPDAYRDTIFFNNIHASRMHMDRLERKGSGYVSHHGEDFLVANDKWFRGLSPQYGPDGAVYVNDWYDKVPCHQQRAQTDRSNGRMYKIVHQGMRKPAHADLAELDDLELVALQLDANDFNVRHARRLLQERGRKPAVHKALEKMLADHPDETRKLRALWALHATRGLDDDTALALLASPMEHLRAWTIQLMLDDGKASAAELKELARLAKEDPSPVVRLYLASAMGRLPLESRWPIAEGLAGRAEDAEDHNLPLLIWYGIEPAIASDKKKAAALIASTKIGKLRQFITRRLSGGAN